MSTEQDQANRETWRRAAEGWERRQQGLREATAPVSQWMVDAIDPQPGQRVLELAAGPGETGFLAAARIAPTGTLLSTDQSTEMVDVARRRAAELGLTNVEFDVLDAQTMELEAGSVDAILCRFGFMLMGDPDSALRRAHDAIRPGGRIAMASWAGPDRNLWMAVPGMQLVARGALAAPDPSAPSPFAMPSPEIVAERLGRAGFEDITATTVEFVQHYPSFETYWASTIDCAAPLQAALSSLEATAAAEVAEAVRGGLGPFTDDDGALAIPASTVVGSATA
jgi:ubiquinone/menaquinone biosynthesis C-methylase UbiE